MPVLLVRKCLGKKRPNNSSPSDSRLFSLTDTVCSVIRLIQRKCYLFDRQFAARMKVSLDQEWNLLVKVNHSQRWKGKCLVFENFSQSNPYDRRYQRITG